MRILHLLPLALLAGADLPAQAQRDDLTPLEIAYTTTVSEDRRTLEIEMTVGALARPRLHLAMPNWTPGAYGIRRFGERVDGLRATDGGGRELEIAEMDFQSWSVDTAGVERVVVRYSVPSTRGWWGQQPDEEAAITGVRINGPSTYLYVPGAKELPVTSSYVLPEGWRVANGLLDAGGPLRKRAKDYDTFIDAPGILGVFEERSFDVGGTRFRCVYFENEQEYDFDLDAFTAIVEKIVRHQGELFGSFPFADYVFLFHIPGGGGLEHLNSTSIGLRADAQRADPRAGASVTSHEFFHAWNVKRIRPVTLGPFEYEHENYTGNLWVSEGWTSYFGDLTLCRTGIWSREEYLDHLAGVISREQSKVRRKEHSVYWASRNAWHRDQPDETEPRVDYYGKGEMLGALIDIKMRHESGGRANLDDFMRFCNRWFAERGVGFEEGDVERLCTAISNHDFTEFFARHVRGTMDPPFAEIFRLAGVEYTEEVIPCGFPFALRGSRVGGRRGQEPEEGMPRPGETVVAVDGADWAGAEAALRGRQPGDEVLLRLRSGEEERELRVTLIEKPTVIADLAFVPAPTPAQRTLREAWLGSVR